MTKKEIFEVIKNIINEVLEDAPPELITMDIKLKDLKELGANSLDRMDITIMTMEELDIKIPMLEFAYIENLRGLVDFLFEKIKARNL